MAYDLALAARIRTLLPPTSSISERLMFGGICFMIDGKMVVGVTNSDLMVRVGKENYGDALARPHARPMDFTGRPLSGFLFIGAAGVKTPKQLRDWVRRCLDYVATLPPPKRKKKKPISTLDARRSRR